MNGKEGRKKKRGSMEIGDKNEKKKKKKTARKNSSKQGRHKRSN